MKLTRILICLAVCCLAAGMAWPQETKTYTNRQYGFELEYPAQWYFKDSSDQIDIYSSESFYSDDKPGAGISILLRGLAVEDEGRVEKAFERISADFGDSIEFRQVSGRTIAGREWHAIQFVETSKAVQGEMYVLIKGIVVYCIGFAYKQPEQSRLFEPGMRTIIDSLRFLDVEYADFNNKGVSFQYPANSEIDEKNDVIMVNIIGSTGSSHESGAAFMVGIAKEESLKSQDERGVFEYLKKQSAKVQVLKEPEPLTVAAQTWLKGEFLIDNARGIVLVYKGKNHFFIIVFAVNPAVAAEEYHPAFTWFLESLSIDYDRWNFTE